MLDVDPSLYQTDQPASWWQYVPYEYFRHCLRTLWLGDTNRKRNDLTWLMLCLEIGGWPKVRIVDAHQYTVANEVAAATGQPGRGRE